MIVWQVPVPRSLATAGRGVNGDDGGAMDDEEQQRQAGKRAKRFV